MKQYLNLLDRILIDGDSKGDRTGTGTISLFGEKMVFDLREGFPLLTTKEVNLKHVLNELLWFISGSTSLKDLVQRGTGIWNKDAYRFYKSEVPVEEQVDFTRFCSMIKNDGPFDMNMGPIYGKQWRDFGGVDQLLNLISDLKSNPEGRRHLISAWNPTEIDKMSLPPCHILFQLNCVEIPQEERESIFRSNRNSYPRILSQEEIDARVPRFYLDLQIYQRSCDTFLGVPYNVASYAALLMMIAKQVGMEARNLHWVGGDTHIYNNHLSQVKTQLLRTPKDLPKLIINPNVKSIEDYQLHDFNLIGYEHHPAIKGKLSVG